jgi:hypothetical protein
MLQDRLPSHDDEVGGSQGKIGIEDRDLEALVTPCGV